MRKLLKRLVREEQGQDVIEYALIAAAISVISIPIIPGIGTTVDAVWNGISAAVGGIPVPAP